LQTKAKYLTLPFFNPEKYEQVQRLSLEIKSSKVIKNVKYFVEEACNYAQPSATPPENSTVVARMCLFVKIR